MTRPAASIGAAVITASVGITAHAAALPLRTFIGDIGSPDAGGVVPVELFIANGGTSASTTDVADRIGGTLEIAGTPTAVTLERAPGQLATVRIEAGGFAMLRYQLRLPAGTAGRQDAMLSLPGTGARPVAIVLAEVPTAAPVTAGAVAEAAVAQVKQSFASPTPDTGNAFLGNLSAYDAIYAVYGPGTTSDARLQISFKYQIFGSPGAGGSLLEGLHFGYTQRLYWDLGRRSSPFRNVDYMPELFYLVPAQPVGETVTLGGRVGIRHESNGRDGAASRSLNTVYVQPEVTLPIGDYIFSVGPRVWAYFGDLSDNPRIRRFRGNTGLSAQIGRDDGVRLTTTTRFNPGSGKGSFDSELSYPLSRLVGSELNFYVFGQAFTGYGENLLDFDRRQTRLRVGLGIVR